MVWHEVIKMTIIAKENSSLTATAAVKSAACSKKERLVLPGKQEESTTSVSEILRDLNKTQYRSFLKNPVKKFPFLLHDFDAYQKSFESFDKYKARKFLGVGWGAIAIELENKKVFKISMDKYDAEMGTRPFDAPTFDRGEVETMFKPFRGNPYPMKLYYIVQPKVKMDATVDDVYKFEEEVKKYGYEFWDCRPGQIGTYQGKKVLVDLNAVERPEKVNSRTKKIVRFFCKNVVLPYDNLKEKLSK